MSDRPHTITDFRRLPAAQRGGRSAAEAKALHDARRANPPRPIAANNRFGDRAAADRARRSVRTVVPLGTVDVLTSVQAANPRLREWSLGQEPGIIDSPWHYREIGSNANWSKRSTFQRGIIVQSYATAADPRRCVFWLSGKMYDIDAPRGYRWDIDANGLRLRACADPRIDYHPTASDLLAGGKHLVAQLKVNVATRRAMARRGRQEQAQHRRIMAAAVREGLVACLADARRAGHCEAGTINWGARHGFSPDGHYTPDQLLAVANGDTKLVLSVIAVALRRHQTEMRQGFSVLADHGR